MITHEQIAEEARAIWLRWGQPAGIDLDVWLTAERSLRSKEELTAMRQAEAQGTAEEQRYYAEGHRWGYEHGGCQAMGLPRPLRREIPSDPRLAQAQRDGYNEGLRVGYFIERENAPWWRRLLGV